MRSGRLTSAGTAALGAVVLTIALEVEIGHTGHLTAAWAAEALLMTAPLAFCLRFPLLALTLVVGGAAIAATFDVLDATSFPVVPVIAVVAALYAVGSRTSGRRLAAGAALSVAGLLAGSALSSDAHGGDYVLDLAVTGFGLLIGRAFGVLRFESDVFAERTSELERERDEGARAAVADERRRISRELHDVIGHSISVMGVQAGAVRSVLREDQQHEREALLAVERVGRDAVGEMRRLIGLLRPDEAGLDAPTPSLRRVEQLVAAMRDSGLMIRLMVGGDASMLSPGVDLAGFRIVQEALTNVLKHAPRACVEVRVTCSARELDVVVVDDGTGSLGLPGAKVGHGLIGMRERTALYGGELVTGPTASGGFSVHARFPIDGV